MKYIAAIKYPRNTNLYFNGAFFACNKTDAVRYESLAPLQTAVSAAYQAGTVSTNEINAYSHSAVRK